MFYLVRDYKSTCVIREDVTIFLGFSSRGHHCLGPLTNYFVLWGFSNSFPFIESIKLLRQRHWNEHMQGRPPLSWHQFTKSTLPEGLAAPPPWWWCLLDDLRFLCAFDSWLVSQTHCTFVLEVLQSVPPRRAPCMNNNLVTICTIQVNTQKHAHDHKNRSS